MANLFDYLIWRGDLTLEQVPLGAVDALVLSALSYVRFHDLVPQNLDGALPVREAVRGFLALPSGERSRRLRSPEDARLLELLQTSPRFSGLSLCGYTDLVEKENQMQFSALCIRLGTAGTFAAFRGTDNTLVGWKEDFNLGYQDTVPAQWTACGYLERCAGRFPGPLFVGGHSKGGNLAVFSAAMCRPQVRQRVRAVYNHDGPGFSRPVVTSAGYGELLPRLHSFVPEASVVGLLLEHPEPYTVVRSSQLGIFQHDPYSWEVLGNEFVQVESVSAGSKKIDQTVKTWLASLTPRQRGEFVDALYALLQSSGTDKMSQALQMTSLSSLFRAFQKGDSETHRAVLLAVGKLIHAALQS